MSDGRPVDEIRPSETSWKRGWEFALDDNAIGYLDASEGAEGLKRIQVVRAACEKSVALTHGKRRENESR